MSLDQIPTLELWLVVATLEAAHEPDERAWAERRLSKWSTTYEAMTSELRRRGAIPCR